MRHPGWLSLVLLGALLLLAACRPDRAAEEGVPSETPVPDAPAGVPVVQEEEPNDTPETANELPSDAWLAGALPSGDVDWIRWPSARRSSLLEVEVASSVTLAVLDVEQRIAQTYRLEPASEPHQLGPFSRESLQWIRLTGSTEAWRVRELSAPAPPGCADPAGERVAEAWPVAWRGCVAQGEEVSLLVPFEHVADLEALSLELALETGERVEVALNDEDGTQLGVWSVDATGWRMPAFRRPTVPGALSVRVRAPAGEARFRLVMESAPDMVDGALWVLEPNDTPDEAFRAFALRDLLGSFHAPEDVDAIRIAPPLPGFGRYALEVQPEGATVVVQALDADGGVTGTVRAQGGVASALGCPRRISEEEPLRLQLFPEPPLAGVTYRLTWQPLMIESPLPTVPEWPWVHGEEEPSEVALDEEEAVEAPQEGAENLWLFRGETEMAGGLYLSLGETVVLALDLMDASEDDHGEVRDADRPSLAGREGTLQLRAAPTDAIRFRLRLLDEEGAVVSLRTSTEEGESLSWSMELPSGRYGLELEALSGSRAACGSGVSFSASWELRDGVEPAGGLSIESGEPLAPEPTRAPPVEDGGF